MVLGGLRGGRTKVRSLTVSAAATQRRNIAVTWHKINVPGFRTVGKIARIDFVNEGKRGVVVLGWVGQVGQPEAGVAGIRASTHDVHDSVAGLWVLHIVARIVQPLGIIRSQVDIYVSHGEVRDVVLGASRQALGGGHEQGLIRIASGGAEVVYEVLETGWTPGKELPWVLYLRGESSQLVSGTTDGATGKVLWASLFHQFQKIIPEGRDVPRQAIVEARKLAI